MSSTAMFEIMCRQFIGGATSWFRSLVSGESSDRTAGYPPKGQKSVPVPSVSEVVGTCEVVPPEYDFDPNMMRLPYGDWYETEVGKAAFPGTRHYGGSGTIHQTGEVNVEIRHGDVVSVWYRCQLLPFTVSHVDGARAYSMNEAYKEPLPTIAGMELVDPEPGLTGGDNSVAYG